MGDDGAQTLVEPGDPAARQDLDLAHIRSRTRRLLDLSPEEPVRIGRFTVVERIGQGGMGVVYLAYDPELDRRVAVKMLRPDAGWPNDEGARARMLREAQAMAKLSHPNVVPVYDIGEVGDRIYLAVEFIEGTTLGEWRRGRHWRELLGVFIQAGRGLAAAHQAGLVHRDFKPGNVMVGEDGRARVLDFGLARSATEVRESGRPDRPGRDAVADSGEGPLTELGAVLGTPAYMSPEQRAGRGDEPSSDQFSFCVTLYEALYQRRPFTDEDILTDAPLRISEPPPTPKIPARIKRALMRGLSLRPEHRFASMPALLAELEGGGRGRLPWIVGGLALALGVAGWVAFAGATADDACREPETRLMGIWDDARKRDIQTAFAQTGMVYASDAWSSVERAMDARAQAWVAAHADSCEGAATGREPRTLHLQRTLCLDFQLQEMQALVDLFGHADREMIERAADAVDELPSVRECDADRVGNVQVPPPSDPGVREQAKAIRIALTEVDALRRAGKYERALELARPLQERGRELDYAPLEAECALAVGRLLAQTADQAAAETTLLEAIELADRGKHDVVAARAWVDLVDVVSTQQARLEEGRRFARLARGAIGRLADDDSLGAELLSVEGAIARLQGHFDEAIALQSEALREMQAHVGPDHAGMARIESALALSLRDAGRLDEALAHARRAQEITQATRGAEHPDAASRLGLMASIVRGQGQDDLVLEWFQRALAIREAAEGPDHPRVASDLHNVASALTRRGQFAEAIPYYERALAIDERTAGADQARIAPTLYEFGMALSELGRPEQATASFERSARLIEAALGPDHPNSTYPLIGLGTVAFDTDDPVRGRAHFEAALRILEKTLGRGHPRYVLTLSDYGGAAVEAGEYAMALDPLEQALALVDGADLTPLDRGTLEFRLARALEGSGGPRARAVSLARSALAVIPAGGRGEERTRGQIERWLAAQTHKD